MNTLQAALGIFCLSLFWAFTGQLLWRFYSFLWRSGIALPGFKKKDAPVATPETAAASVESVFSRVLHEHGPALIGLLGCLLAAWAFFWLLGDLVADQFTQKVIQLVALLVLTAALLYGGYRIRRAGPDTLGTGLMLLGFLQIPVDGWFYETYILGYTTRSAYQTFLTMAVLGTFLCVRTGSRTFGWLAPQCLFASIMLIGYKFQWPTAATSYLAALAGPLFLAVGLWLESVPAARLFLTPVRVASFLSAIGALTEFLGSTPEAVPWLPLAVALLGGGTVAAVAYLASDLRGLLLLLPYFGVAFVEYFERYSTSYGPVGTVAALAGLALLALETTRRRGAERRRGLDPWCAVPALFLLLLALSIDGLSAWLSVSRVASLRPPQSTGTVGFEDAGMLWGEAERAIYYLARLDRTLAWAALSGPLTAAGIVYMGSEAAIPLFAYGGGVPLAVGALAALLRCRPFELHGTSYVFYLTVLALLGAGLGVRLRRTPWLPAARAFGVLAHLLLPLAWYALAYRVYHPQDAPGWFLCLVLAVVGAQAFLHGQYAGEFPILARAGCGLIALAWPLAIGTMPGWHARDALVVLVASGLVVNGALLARAIAAQDVVQTILGGGGLVLTVVVTLSTVLHGEIGAKLAILVFGLGLLYLGTRGRRWIATSAVVLAVSAGGALAGPLPHRVTTRESLQALARANPEDPLILVMLRAAGFPVPPPASTDQLAGKLQAQFGALSGIDTVQAALQVIASPQRLRYDGKDGVRSYLRELTPIAPRSLQYRELARRLPGQPQLPDSAGDALDRVPACWIQLRFRDAAAFGRILDLYDRKGRALLAVTAPGLALPSPELKFREMTGVDLRKAAEGCASGELLIGDPYLGLAPRLVLILQFPDARSASERAGAWTTPAGADRVHASFELAMVATTADAIAEVRPILCGGEAGGLKFQPDFLYASLLKLHGDDGRLFVSEAAVKVLVSPAFWIGSHRRTDCLAELADLEAADAFGRLTQRPLPVDAGGATRAALERQWLAPNGQCRSRGAISRTNDGLFACSVHGTRRAPRPLRDAELDPIASSEKSAYSDFAWRYGWLYSTWIDPICIAIEAGPERAVLETAILPVAQQPAYQTLLSWNRRVDRGERRRPIALPRGYDQAVVAVAARLPVDDEDWRWNPRFNMFYGRYYFQEPALWRLRELEKPSPLGNSLGLMLFAGDLEFLRQPGLLLHSKVPAPMAMTREVVSAERARRWLSELMGENGHWSQGSAEGFGFRAAGELSVHAAIDDRALVLATSREKAKELMAAPARSGSLPGAGGWVRLRPGALWESARAFRSLGAGFLANRCRAILASRQNALDLGVALSAKPDCPTGDPFVEPGATCPAGGKYDTDGPLARCSLHGTMELPLDPPPAEDSPLGALLRSAGALEAEAAALDDGVLTRVVLESR